MSEQPAQPPSSDELATCRRVLNALCQTDGTYPANDANLVEVHRLAARLVRLGKKSQRQQVRCRDEELLDATDIRSPPLATCPLLPPAPVRVALPTAVLSRPRTCYICKQSYTQLHSFYDCLCPVCGDFNQRKREQTADLRGRFVLVTGARVKIGFQIGLKLLRSGATVLATTRFPHDAARRYADQPDADEWADRLQIYGIDLRHLTAVEHLVASVAASHTRLDVLIHNAAQTVRRPPAFYHHLLAGERCEAAQMLPLARRMLGPALTAEPKASEKKRLQSELASARLADFPNPLSLPNWTWAELSQVPLLPGDEIPSHSSFPAGELDVDAQQVDLRPRNSWGMPLKDVSTVELLEVQAVNCLAPFLLLRGLGPLLRAGPERDRYVVLVSAVEGQFGTGWKDDRHPHTNMAKASLNMITRSCAKAYATERIFLTSVDTGWISNEAAHPAAERMRAEGFRPPLDAEDGAARVLDPVFTGMNTGTNLHDVFLKDYHPAPW